VVADPHADLYAAFGVGTSIIKAFSPGVFSARRRALAKGHEFGLVDGNAFRMPGAFLVRGGEIVWSHKFKHSAEQPDFDRAAQLAV
jgi:hypothetical protein